MTSAVLEQTFWGKVRKGEGCWLWTGALDETGRGRFRLNGRHMTAPRAALVLASGPPESEELHALHSCDNPGCCRPDHLRWGSREENMQEMAQKGRAGIQRHPERYKRARRPDVPYRPVKQPGAPHGIDSRTWTRLATSGEVALATRALEELESQRNRIALVPAPDPHFDSHKIRVIESRNPAWYIEFGKKYWHGPRQFDLKRTRVAAALKRVVAGRVRGNGYERQLLEFLKGW